MMKINIRTNFPQVVAEMNRLGRDMGDKAMVRALNKTVAQGETEMARRISKEFNISSATAKSRLAIRRASAKGGAVRFEAILEASRRGKGRSMNLIAFVEKSVSMAEARRRAKKGTLNQLRFQIKRSGGKKTIAGAFIQNKGRTVFIRTGKSRFPIKALNTIGIGQMFNTRRINSAVIDVMLKRFAVNFQREARALSKGFIK